MGNDQVVGRSGGPFIGLAHLAGEGAVNGGDHRVQRHDVSEGSEGTEQCGVRCGPIDVGKGEFGGGNRLRMSGGNACHHRIEVNV